MKKALIAIDNSDVSKNLIRYAFQYAWLESLDQLDFIHVTKAPIIYPTWYVSPQPDSPAEEDVREHFISIIQKEMEKSKEKETPYTFVIESGTPYQQIIEKARTGNYDLIMIGHRGMSNVKRFLIGSVALKVATHAACKVLVYQ